MNIKDIISILTMNLPKHTDEFSDFVLNITKSFCLSSRKIKVECSDPHGLENNDSVVVTGLKIKNLIESIEINGEFARITLKAKHDYTNQENLFFKMEGNDRSEWNGDFLLYNVANSLIIEIEKPSDTIPTAFGYIWEDRDRGGKGVVTVSKVDGNSFTYDINENDPNLPITDDESIKDIQVIKGVRVAGVADPERSIQIYTNTYKEKKKSFAFVMFPDEVVSKDSKAQTEAVASFGTGDDSKQSVLINFDVCVIQPSSDLGAVEQVDKACGEIRNALLKSIVGIKGTEQNSSAVYKITYNGSSMFQYDTATYIRVYSFQLPFDINYANTAENDVLSVALRKAVLKLQTGTKDALKTEAVINTNEE